MRRFHVNVAVADLDESIRFYSTLFDAQPAVIKEDYAKWMLDDPRINFAVETRSTVKGVNHLGIQVESADDLAALRENLEAAEGAILDQPDVTCCYARSSKAWISDPNGVSWETFLTHGDSTDYGEETGLPMTAAESKTPASKTACC